MLYINPVGNTSSTTIAFSGSPPASPVPELVRVMVYVTVSHEFTVDLSDVLVMVTCGIPNVSVGCS